MIFAFRYGDDPLDYFILLVLTLIAVIISLVLHELAHGLVAKWNGDYTAKYAGRLTLNPLKHIDPIGFLMMMLVGFGYAKPVPVNPYNFKHYRRGMITVAIAGVVVNLVIAFIGALGLCLMNLALNHAAGTAAIKTCWYLLRFFGILVSLNLCLLFFNILPIFPLDGFRIVEAFTHRGNRFCAFMRTNGRYILYGLVGLSFIVSTDTENLANLPSW
ncbi:MAG: site-2 protease family protein, partial [Clostridiales bacterium]|nr:site-2 protease family protein [Clostridiales bacterium]